MYAGAVYWNCIPKINYWWKPNKTTQNCQHSNQGANLSTLLIWRYLIGPLSRRLKRHEALRGPFWHFFNFFNRSIKLSLVNPSLVPFNYMSIIFFRWLSKLRIPWKFSRSLTGTKNPYLRKNRDKKNYRDKNLSR